MKRYLAFFLAVDLALLSGTFPSCSVDSLISLPDEVSELLEEEEAALVYTYSSGPMKAYGIYDETITVIDDATLSIGTLEDGMLSGTSFYVVITDETITISDGSSEDLVYIRVEA